MRKITLGLILIGLVLSVSAIALIPTTDASDVPRGCNAGQGWQMCSGQCGGISNLACMQKCCRGIQNDGFADTTQVVIAPADSS